MRYSALAGAVVTLALVMGAHPSGLRAQDAPEADAPDAVVTEEAADAAALEDALLGEEELDELVAPVALYPDSLLTQVLVASTVPLDVIKADRFLTAEKDLSDKDRAAKAEAEDWDPSVQVLAGGFPTVIQKMAAEIDWTEQLGDAMLAQTDDVLDAVQRQRARAAAVGNLETNEAQVVEQTEDSISIAPAEPDVVYVPQYDATTAYTTPYRRRRSSTSRHLHQRRAHHRRHRLRQRAAGQRDLRRRRRLGRLLGRRPEHRLGRRRLRSRPGINVDGDVNIDRERQRRSRPRLNIDRDAVNIDRDKIGDRADLDRGGTWKPSPEKQADARARQAERKGREGGPKARGAPGTRSPRARRGGASSQDIGEKLAKREGKGGGGDAAARLADHKPPALKGKDSALKAKNIDPKKAKAAANRGDLSKNKGKAKQAAKAHPKGVSKAKAAQKPPKKSGAKASAMKKGHGGKAKSAKARGGKSQRRRPRRRRRRAQALDERIARR